MARSKRPVVLSAGAWAAVAMVLTVPSVFAVPGGGRAALTEGSGSRWSVLRSDASPVATASPGTSPEALSSLGLEPSPSPTVVEVAADWADGPFDLPDPTVGLAELTDYVATLKVTFSGTRSGTPIDATTSTTLSVAPEGRVLTIERGPDGPTTFRAEIAGAAYAKEGDGPCTVGSIVDGDTLADVYELAAQLPPLIGAAEAGSGTVNGTGALQHTFDRRSLMVLGAASGTGEVWTAETGGQVVRYLLSMEVGPAYFGEDTTGTRTLDYQLTVPDGPIPFKLPDDCPPQLPLLADATEIVRWSDLLTFRSSMPVAKAAKSYGALLKRLGWKPAVPQDVSKELAVLAFRKRGSVATVIMRGDPAGIAVKVALTRQPAGQP